MHRSTHPSQKQPTQTQPKRVFVVGCPRSGTTLLQSILLTNGAIMSFPESHFFVNLFRRRRPLSQRFKLASPYSRPGFESFLRAAGHPEMSLPSHALTLGQHTRAFIRTLDDIARAHHKSIWIEKTPDHVNFIDFIETQVDNALFIHIVRNGPDVVASLYDVTHKYPVDWEGPWDINRCLKKWMTCVKNTHRHCQKKNHLLINYERLVDNPAVVCEQLGEFMGVDLEPDGLTKRQRIFEQITLKNEPWKAKSGEAIYKASTRKFYQLFDRPQQSHVLRTLEKAELLGANV